MAEQSVPVDLLNPGQVFACLGLAEAASRLSGPTRAKFEWSDRAEPIFTVATEAEEPPVATVLEFLRKADVISLSPRSESGPDEAGLSTEKWQVPTEDSPPGYPFSRPPSPATLVGVLRAELGGAERRIPVTYWGDSTNRDNVKFWAGSGGYPGAALLRDALALVRDEIESAIDDPFSLSAAQSSSFRFDWRRDYVPMGIGFSLNEHGSMVPLGYPLVELLAAIGLSHARPQRPSRRDKLSYRYAVIETPFSPLPLLRAALGCAPLPFTTRTFRMVLDWPGQEGQARCITDVIEETQS